MLYQTPLPILESTLSYMVGGYTAALIYKPDLGLTDTPTELELTARQNLTMIEVGQAEIELTGGYQRYLSDNLNPLIVPTPDNNAVGTTLYSEFTPTPDSEFEPATHIVYIKGMTEVLTDLNGNGRGGTTGEVILVEPLLEAPLIVSSPAIYTHSAIYELGSFTNSGV
jgi:hypothetical protein